MARALLRPLRLGEGLSLATRFLLVGLLVFAGAAIVIGTWVGDRIEEDVLTRTGAITSLYVDSIVSPQLQSLARRPTLDETTVATLDRLVARSTLGERIVALKVWSPDGTILYSPTRDLIGRRFPVEGGLAKAIQGQVAAEMSDLSEDENVYERSHWSRLLEIYAPVRQDAGGEILGVTEFYELPDELDARIADARRGAWALVGLTMLVAYALLAGIVKAGSDTIARQQRSLRAQVTELRSLLTENRRLQERVSNAALRTTTLNEQALRRISADLHDGPAQALGFALLRLEEAGGDGPLTGARRAIADALAEIRAIASGLRLPDLGPLSLQAVVERVVEDHRRRSGIAVELRCEALPDEAPLAIKTALVRTLQEALSNATRHGLGRGVAVRVSASDGMLHLIVQDAGPGFLADRPTDGGLGIAGMRERAELLGGRFGIASSPGHGAVVSADWPLAGGSD